jgi:1-aminocyclopropane-1-carboxylate deaminase/D-cysteine desulfhydrase-like pyridoxal-dependent ACC family enzyme
MTPLQEIQHDVLTEANVKLIVKREDLNHPSISGNKWWKLKYNLEEAAKQKKKTLLTFGGAYSNHIYATAAAAKDADFESVGLIRGEQTLPLNATLSFARACGMTIHYINREDYRRKHEKKFIEGLRNKYEDFYLIPEGGTNDLAVKGCVEFAAEYLKNIDADYVCLAVGTGGTMAGVIEGIQNKKEVVGFPVLKGGEFLSDEIKTLIKNFSGMVYNNWRLETDYHFGGYAKSSPELENFISTMQSKNNLPLDKIYTAKLMWGILDCVKKGEFERGSTILAIHTGGLQTLTF